MNIFKLIKLIIKKDPVIIVLFVWWDILGATYFITSNNFESLLVIVASIILAILIFKFIILCSIKDINEEYENEYNDLAYKISKTYIKFDYKTTIYIGKEFYNYININYKNNKYCQFKLDKKLKDDKYKVVIDESFLYKNEFKTLFNIC
jgi:hypothetical protein